MYRGRSRLFVTCFVALYSLIFALQMWSLSAADVVNRYPYISPDGFDWYLEGVYLAKILKGVELLPSLPILRPPVFVLINMVDYVAGANGLILG